MPKYIFYHKTEKKKLEVECRIDQLDKVIEDNKAAWDLLPTAPAIISGVASPRNKPDGWFTDKMKEIKKTLPERYKKNISDHT